MNTVQYSLKTMTLWYTACMASFESQLRSGRSSSTRTRLAKEYHGVLIQCLDAVMPGYACTEEIDRMIGLLVYFKATVVLSQLR